MRRSYDVLSYYTVLRRTAYGVRRTELLLPQCYCVLRCYTVSCSSVLHTTSFEKFL
jgi:hypothetical protein